MPEVAESKTLPTCSRWILRLRLAAPRRMTGLVVLKNESTIFFKSLKTGQSNGKSLNLNLFRSVSRENKGPNRII